VLDRLYSKNGSYLCPQAYPEGCPTHPAYPGATATIGGAGVRVLKALFNPNFVIPEPVVPSDDGLSLRPWKGEPLTVGGELNKLAFNMAFGRDTAGVHFRKDELEGIFLGEGAYYSAPAGNYSAPRQRRLHRGIRARRLRVLSLVTTCGAGLGLSRNRPREHSRRPAPGNPRRRTCRRVVVDGEPADLTGLCGLGTAPLRNDGAVGYRRAARAAWSRSRNGTCAAFSLRRALVSLNHSTRSISGKVSTRPDPGGHSVW
jgi:hypothetical protein